MYDIVHILVSISTGSIINIMRLSSRDDVSTANVNLSSFLFGQTGDIKIRIRVILSPCRSSGKSVS